MAWVRLVGWLVGDHKSKTTKVWGTKSGGALAVFMTSPPQLNRVCTAHLVPIVLVVASFCWW